MSSLFLPRTRGFICSYKSRYHRLLSNLGNTDNAPALNASPDPRYVNLRHAPNGFDITSAVVYPTFLTEQEGKSIIKEVGQRMKRRPFENGHWDSVITGYREVELPDEPLTPWQSIVPKNCAVQSIIQKTRRHLEKNMIVYPNGKSVHTGSPENVTWLPCHAIDLSAQGELSAHVDSVKFSGDIVAGLSLLSDAIMRLRPSSLEWKNAEEHKVLHFSENEHNGFVDLYLPQLSLYVLSGMSRYHYTHELLQSKSAFDFVDTQGNTVFEESIDVIRGRRISIIFRDRKRN
jgi:alkylated DNA repair protein alkB family protein 7